MWDVVNDPARYNLNVNSGTQRKLNGFIEVIRRFIDKAANQDAETVARDIIMSTGLLSQYLSESTPENISKVQNLEELLRSAHDYVADQLEAGEEERGMAEFLNKVSLLTDQDTEDPALRDSVTLMTIHAAKGLEFAHVFVVGVEEDLLPSGMGKGTIEEIEEERRLFYVAITRAKKFCMVSFAKNRYLNGQTTVCRPSRFLKDINPRYLKFSYGAEDMPVRVQEPAKRSYQEPAIRKPLFSMPTPTQSRNTGANSDSGSIHRLSELKPGMKVVHFKFGSGTIISLDSKDIGDVAIVQFNNENTPRQLLLKFARFTIQD